MVGRNIRGRRVGTEVEADDGIDPLKGRLVLLVHSLRLKIFGLKPSGSFGLTGLGETTQQVGDRFAVAPLGEATELDSSGGISGPGLGRIEGSVDKFSDRSRIGLRGLFLAIVGHGPVDVPGQRRHGLFAVQGLVVLAGDSLALRPMATGTVFAVDTVPGSGRRGGVGHGTLIPAPPPRTRSQGQARHDEGYPVKTFHPHSRPIPEISPWINGQFQCAFRGGLAFGHPLEGNAAR